MESNKGTLTISPRKLTASERAAYNRDGFVVVPQVFSPEELLRLDQEVSRLMSDQNVAKTRGGRFILELTRYSNLLEKYSADPRLLALVEDLVGPGLAIFETKLLEKKPRDEVVCHWHQDEAYFRQVRKAQLVSPQVQDDSTPTETDKTGISTCCLSAWFPLRDVTSLMGCLLVVPGSYRAGLHGHHQVDYDTCRLTVQPGTGNMPGAIECPVPAGSVLLFSALTLHASGGNRTDQPRRAIIVSYQEASLPHDSQAGGRVLRPA